VDIVLSLAVGGLMIGSLYGLLAVTVTVMFRTTGTLSFAHGGFALIAAYSYAGMACGKTVSARCTGDATLEPWMSALLAILLSVATALVVERVVMRPLANASPVNRMIATVAILSLCAGVCLQLNGPLARTIPQRGSVLPDGGFTLAGVVVDYQRATIFALSLVLVIVTVAVLRYTWLGLALRACGQSPDAARLMGVRPAQVAQFNWAAAGAVSGLAGVLVAPITVVNTGTFAFLMVNAVAACVIGGLVSVPMTLAGGLVIGLVEAVTPHYSGKPGAPSVVIAVAVLLAVTLNRKRLRDQVSRSPVSAIKRVSRAEGAISLWLDGLRRLIEAVPRPLRFLPVLALLVIAMRNNYYASVGLNIMYFALVVLSLVVMTGLSSQPSLMQAGFVGIGAFTLATSVSKGLPFLSGAALAIVLGAVAGVITGLVSVWFRRLEFAIITLTLGALIANFALGDPSLKNTMLAPEVLGLDMLESRNALIVMGVIAALCFVLVARLRNSTIGSALRASSEMDERIEHFAINPARWEITAFALSGGIAAFAGCVFALVSSSFGTGQFGPIVSLTLLVTAVVGGMGSLYGCVLAGILFGYGPQLLAESSSDTANAYPAIIGAVLALLLLVKAPAGLAGLFDFARDNLKAMPAHEQGGRFRGYTVKLLDVRPASFLVPGPGGSSDPLAALRTSTARGRPAPVTDASPRRSTVRMEADLAVSEGKS
jgi:branched-chain amino acid transport system permease protein